MKQLASLAALLQEEPAQVLEWVLTISQSEPEALARFNWLGLAEIAEFRATVGHGDSTRAIMWARVALAAYEYLQKRTHVDVKGVVVHSAMHLRAHMIARYGLRVDDNLLDPGIVVHWFFESVELSRSQVLGKLLLSFGSRHQLRADEIEELLHLTNALEIVSLLPADIQAQYGEDLRLWLTLKDILP